MSLLDRLGADVELSVGLPDAADDVALLLADRLDEEQTDELLDWVRGGGTLVVTDPGSSLAPSGVGAADPLDPDDVDRGICTLDALDGVEVVDGGAARPLRHRAGATAAASGAATSPSWSPRPRATATSSPSAGPPSSPTTASATTTTRCWRPALLAPTAGHHACASSTRRIPAGGGDKTLYELISDGVRRAGLQLGLAFVLYAVWRAIRLRASGARGAAGRDRRLRAGRRRPAACSSGAARQERPPRCSATACDERSRARLGVAAAASPDALAQVVAERAGVDLEQARAAVGDHPVTTEGELVAVARAVASVHQEVLR